MKRFLLLKWKNIWPWVILAVLAYFLAKQIVQ